MERALALADAGFSPSVLGSAEGFLVQRWHPGRYFPQGSELPLGRIAEYLAFRRWAFACEARPGALDEMLHVNVNEACGRDVPAHAKLEIAHPLICDGSLMPHEWLSNDAGVALKTDAFDHGDDHLFPGPCDIAWDLAGVVIEWGLNRDERDWFLSAYRRKSGDDASGRLAAYELAYCAFRVGCMRMAMLGAEAPELTRLELKEARYRRDLLRRLPANDSKRERPNRCRRTIPSSASPRSRSREPSSLGRRRFS